MSAESTTRPGLPEVDVAEHGGKKDGVAQVMDRRLFMQLQVFDAAPGSAGVLEALATAFDDARVPAVFYDDASAPLGLGVLTWSDDPAHFVERVHPLLRAAGASLTQREGWTMLGRTYAIGYEPDLEHWLLRRPVEHATNEEWPWAVWYPLRRTGAFAKLERKDQQGILREHAQIGFAYGQKDLAHDIRLACHGLDARDNEFVIGLVGKTLHPLSHLVQAMRSTKQTSEYIAQMGPFFVGYLRRRAGGA
jgi:hypothetical protein